MKENKSCSRRLRNDVIFICALLFVAALVLLFLFVFREKGDVVRVTVDGRLVGTYALSENASAEIRKSKDDEDFNLLVIRDGKAYIDAASCPDGICVAHRPIFRDGESIVCLPNRVVVTVVSQKDENEPDISI